MNPTRPPKTNKKRTVTQEFLYDVVELLRMLDDWHESDENLIIPKEICDKSNEVWQYLLDKTDAMERRKKWQENKLNTQNMTWEEVTDWEELKQKEERS